MLPRLVSRLDTLAELVALRAGNRRLRSGRSSWQRCGPELNVSHSAAMGGDHHGTRRAPAADLTALRHAHNRSGGGAADFDHRGMLLAGNICPAADPPEFSGN